ncbi:MAG: pirin family protein [Sphaerochaetaceae bacterium]
MGNRQVKRVVEGKVSFDGAGVKLNRMFGGRDSQEFDPFLLLDGFDSTKASEYLKGFPWHPHRGIETVTYLISGEIDHQDSLGNSGVIRGGECQWMTAGSGILHQEMPQESDHLLGVQLWVNLPQKEKMVRPAYRDIRESMMGKVAEEGAIIKIIAGTYQGKVGAIEKSFVEVRLLDVLLEGNTTWTLPTEANNTLFCYLFGGSATFEEEGEVLGPTTIALLERGDNLVVRASKEGARFLVAEGPPLNEEIAWGGPIVMNTREEIHQAFKELEEGTFIKGY